MAYTAQQLAAAIAHVESGGNYKAHSKTSSASGKYQYLKSTWANFGGYAEAYLAPPEVQDAKAIADITNKLHAYGGDVRKAAMSWFLPAAVNNPALAAKVPKGNGINPNQYADKVLKALGAPVTQMSGEAPVDEAIAPTSNLSDPKQQLANFYALLTTPATKLTQF